MVKHTRPRRITARSQRWTKTASIGIGVALVAALGIGVAVFAWRSDQEATQAAASPAGAAGRGVVLPVVDVYKDPTCGCCSKWVDHLKAHGFTVRTKDTRDLVAFKADHGVPSQLHSCHTALADGYVLEGHVPAADIGRVLTERPAIAGVAVAGMPIGSPGMEVPGVNAQPYDVVAFEMTGNTRVFATHR